MKSDGEERLEREEVKRHGIGEWVIGGGGVWRPEWVRSIGSVFG